MEGQSLTEMKGGMGGGNTNWKTLCDVKAEHLGHGEKVHTRTRTHMLSVGLTRSDMEEMATLDILLFKNDSLKIIKDKLRGFC